VDAPGALREITRDTAEAVVGEVKWVAFEEILKGSALVATAHIPVVGILVGIGRVASDVRARQIALRERNELERRIDDAHYQPGPIDVMFTLPGQLRDEDRITASVVDLAQRVIDALFIAAKSDQGHDDEGGE